jgi:hypothetical protein
LKKRRIVFGILVIAAATIIFITLKNPFFFSQALTSYKTQSVLYKHNYDSKLTIEFQMKDIGALGYQRRIVKIKEGFLFNTVEIIDTTKIDKSKWKFVDEEVNELKLKYP